MPNWNSWENSFTPTEGKVDKYGVWTPPDGTYNAQIISFNQIDITLEGRGHIMLKWKLRMVGGNFAGMEFQRINTTKYLFQISQDFQACGVVLKQINDTEMEIALSTLIGRVIEVTVKTNTKGYTNVYINALIEANGQVSDEPTHHDDADADFNLDTTNTPEGDTLF